MGVFNRRNATLGWLAMLIAKRLLRRKARAVAAAIAPARSRPTRKAFALLAATAAGGAALRRRRAGGGSEH